MINPSANGWIEKFFQEQNVPYQNCNSTLEVYQSIRVTGFIYGHVVSLNTNLNTEISNLKKEETLKLALISNLFQVYNFYTKSVDVSDFISKITAFYTLITPKSFNLLSKIVAPDLVSELEYFINSRVQTNKDVVTKNFSHIVFNALLFTDVLAFNQFLATDTISTKQLKKTEELIIGIALLCLKIKTVRTDYDNLVLKLFEASIRYSKFSEIEKTEKALQLNELNLSYFKDDFEKLYLLDIAAMTLWSDGKIENEELYFLEKVANQLNLTLKNASESNEYVREFILNHKKDIDFINYSNPLKHFYDQTTNNVSFLITRNKIRLIKELKQSKELLVLIKKSTKQDLDKEEKKKVKKQLLDICKTIPSLAIFLLPGGSLLFPIFIRFIPQLLPSAFNENFED